MALEPDYGETHVSAEEAKALTTVAREILGDPIRKADLYDLEQQIQDEVADEWWGDLLNWRIPVRDLLTDHFVRELHRRLYAPSGSGVVVSDGWRQTSAPLPSTSP